MIEKRDEAWVRYKESKEDLYHQIEVLKTEFWRENRNRYRQVERLDMAIRLVDKDGCDPVYAYMKCK
jgi:hypothetical protein